MEFNKQVIYQAIENATPQILAVGDGIFDHPETLYQERESSRIVMDALRREDFAVEEAPAGIPTAFVARYGKGGAAMGILAEYDALPGLSQQPGMVERKAVTPGGNGHGCGHNLIAAGCVAAAIGMKAYLKATGKTGRILVYGCPAEEGGAGKGFLARDGVFGEADCALTWHPGDYNAATVDGSLANCQLAFRFTGMASHAALSPQLGRSALDAAELMNVGVQFLREHIPQDWLIHYALTDAGGYSPNVVQPKAEVLYLMRAPRLTDVAELRSRVEDIAQGAALMTGTQVEVCFVKACSNLIPNRTLAKLFQKNLEEAPCPTYTDQEIEFARNLQKTFGDSSDAVDRYLQKFQGNEAVKAQLKAYRGKAIYDGVFPIPPQEETSFVSTDVGDVSCCCPTAQIVCNCHAARTDFHSWQAVAQGKSSIAHKGVLYAGKVLAATAADLWEHPQWLEQVRQEWLERSGGGEFRSPIPRAVQPPFPTKE